MVKKYAYIETLFDQLNQRNDRSEDLPVVWGSLWAEKSTNPAYVVEGVDIEIIC